MKNIFFIFLVFAFSNISAQFFRNDYTDCYELRSHSKYVKVKKVTDGEHTFYDSHKQGVVSGTFKNGRLVDGRQYMYNVEGILDRIVIYKNGMYVGDAKIENEEIKDSSAVKPKG